MVAHLAEGTVFRCRSIQGTGKVATHDELKSIRGRPWAPTGTVNIAQKRSGRTESGDGISDGSSQYHFIPRSMPITREVLERVGYTEGCSKCRAVARGGPHSGGHSAKCREIIEKKVALDGELKGN